MTPQQFPYQQIGSEFLASGRFRYLGDQMGLGKTSQAIKAFDMSGARRGVVIAPVSAIPNWEREIETWSANPERWSVQSYGDAATFIPRSDVHIVDEAQYVKTPTSQRTAAILGTNSPLRSSDHVWPLSGTPAPNNPLELWTWVNFFGQTKLSYRGFLERYCYFSDGLHGPVIRGMRNAKELAALLRPVLLRRTLGEVGLQLPPVRWGEISLRADVDVSGLDDGLVVDGELLPTPDEHLSRALRQLGEAKADPLGRFLAEELEATTTKMVVMSAHPAVLDILARHFAPFGTARIDGNTPRGRRGGEVDRFQNDPSCRVFLGQLVAAGTAITLTAAQDFVFADMSWVTGDNDQAWRRIYRIGQKYPCLIRTASLRGSLDEVRSRVLARKTKMLQQLYEELIA